MTQLPDGLSPHRRPGEYVFAATDPDDRSRAAIALASVVEPNGLSIVLSREDADEARIGYDSVFGWITLMVESSLDSVGLTAVVSGVLAQSGNSCNVRGRVEVLGDGLGEACVFVTPDIRLPGGLSSASADVV